MLIPKTSFLIDTFYEWTFLTLGGALATVLWNRKCRQRSTAITMVSANKIIFVLLENEWPRVKNTKKAAYILQFLCYSDGEPALTCFAICSRHISERSVPRVSAVRSPGQPTMRSDHLQFSTSPWWPHDRDVMV